MRFRVRVRVGVRVPERGARLRRQEALLRHLVRVRVRVRIRAGARARVRDMLRLRLRGRVRVRPGIGERRVKLGGRHAA